MKDEKDDVKFQLTKTIPFKASMFALNGLFFASHLTLNSRYLSDLSDGGADASSIASTYLSAVLGGGVGVVLSTGLNYGPLVGKGKMVAAGQMAKSAITLGVGTGLVLTALGLLPLAIFPSAYEHDTGKMAAEFIAGYAPGIIGMILNVIAIQLTFVNDEWYSPPLAMLGVLALAGAFSYLLGFTAGLDAFGVGLGGSIANLLTGAFMLLSLTREKYAPYGFYRGEMGPLKSNIATLWSDGWKISFQRMSEWINQFAIATVIAHTQSSALGPFNSAMVTQLLFGILMQSYGQAISMIVSKNHGVADDIGKPSPDNSAKLLATHANNVSAAKKGNLGGIAISALCGLVASALNKPLAHAFLPRTTSHGDINMARSLDIVNGIGMVADGASITLAGTLRGWNDLLFPPILRFGLMTLVGVPAGYGISQYTGMDVSHSLLWTRNGAALLSTFILALRVRKQLNADHDRYALKPTSTNMTPLLDAATTPNLYQTQQKEDNHV